MANTSSRTLRLLTLLQSRRYWPGADLAERLEVSVRTLRRDVDRLRELGYPVEGVRGSDGGYQLAAGAALPPLALEDDEAVALAVGLQAATASSVAPMAEPSLRALAKVVQVLPPRLRRQVDALRSMTVTATWASSGPGRGAGPDPGNLLIAAQACRAEEGLALSYVAADGTRTERHVEPYRLVSFSRHWYLVAYDLHRQAWRNFRVDRVETITPDGRRFRPRDLPAEDAGTFVRESLSSGPANYEVVATLHCPAALATERLGAWAQLEDLPEDCCRLTLRTESLAWAAFALGSIGVELSDVGPPALVDVLADWARRFAVAAALPPGADLSGGPTPAPAARRSAPGRRGRG